jgi:hypothetical protein
MSKIAKRKILNKRFFKKWPENPEFLSSARHGPRSEAEAVFGNSRGKPSPRERLTFLPVRYAPLTDKGF